MIRNYNSYSDLPSHFPSNFDTIDESVIWRNHIKKSYFMQKYIIFFGLLTLIDIITYYSYWNNEEKVFNRYLLLTFVLPFLFIYILSLNTNKKWIAKIFFSIIIILIISIQIYISTLIKHNMHTYLPIMTSSIFIKSIISVIIVYS